MTTTDRVTAKQLEQRAERVSHCFSGALRVEVQGRSGQTALDLCDASGTIRLLTIGTKRSTYDYLGAMLEALYIVGRGDDEPHASSELKMLDDEPLPIPSDGARAFATGYGESDDALASRSVDSFAPTHRYRATRGDDSVLVQLVGEGLHESEALVVFADRIGATRVAKRSLIDLDDCSCEYEEDGDGENGPHLTRHEDANCPQHALELLDVDPGTHE